MNEETKFDLDKDIIMQIEMDSYMKYNDTIASMNEHLGEIYGYSDVKDMEETQLKYEKKLAYKAIKYLQEKVEQLEKENEATLKNYGNLVKEWKQLEKENKELTKVCELYIQTIYNEGLKKVEQLEKYVNKVINTCTIQEYIKDKLKELKESDNNVKEINTNNN